MSSYLMQYGLLIGLLFSAAEIAYTQVPESDDHSMTRLGQLVGTWQAAGDGFSTKLEYQWRFPGVALQVDNVVYDADGAVAVRYHGAYYWDADSSSIRYFAVSDRGAVHTGEAYWRDGFLWHDAEVRNSRISRYRSALKTDGGLMQYFATYGSWPNHEQVLDSPPIRYSKDTGANSQVKSGTDRRGSG